MDKYTAPEDDPCFIPPFLRKADFSDDTFKAPEPKTRPRPGIVHPSLGKPSALWPYTDKTGNTVCYICRFDLPANGSGRKKDYRPYTRIGDEWAWRGLPEPRPLYNLHRLVASRDAPVVIVEGEKAADALKALLPDFVPTTAMHGAQSPGKTDWSPLRGRDVIIWPDLDAAGFQFMETVAGLLKGIGVDPMVIPFEETPLKDQEGLKGNCLKAPADVLAVSLRGATSFKEDDPFKDWPFKGWDAADAVQESWDAFRIRNVVERAVPYVTLRKEPTEPSTPPAFRNEFERAGPRFPLRNEKPDLSVLNPEATVPEFPLRTFGPYWSEWIEDRAAGVSAPPDYVGCSLLAGSSALIGNAVWVSPWQDWTEAPVLWMALVGSPSSGKSPAMDPVIDLLKQLDAERAPDFQNDLRDYETAAMAAKLARDNWEKDCKEIAKQGGAIPPFPPAAEPPLKPEFPSTFISDVTMEALAKRLAVQPKGILNYRDELAGWLGNFDRYGGQGGDRAFWLESYGGRSFRIERVKHGGEPINIANLSVATLGGIQPDRLNTLLMKGDDDGLPARFLYTWPNAIAPKRPFTKPDDRRALAALRRLARLDMLTTEDGALKPRVIRLNEDAADLFEEWQRNDFQAEPQSRLAGWWGKGKGRVLRLALNLQLLWWAASGDGTLPPAIGLEAMGGAIALMEDYFKPMARRVYGDGAASRPERLAATLAQAILDRRPEIVNARELYKIWGLPGITTKDTAQMALHELEEANWLTFQTQPPGPTGGRPRSDYRVNPEVYALISARQN